MVLAAAFGAHAALAGQRTERSAVLDGGRVRREVVAVVANALEPRRGPVQVVRTHQGEEDHNHERARAAHSRRRRKVALEYQVDAAGHLREVPGQAAQDGQGICRPADVRQWAVRVEHQRRAASEVGHRQAPVCAGSGNDVESSFRSADEAAASAVVGVLAEHLDATGHVPGVPRLLVAALGRKRRQQVVESDRVSARGLSAEAGHFERACQIRRNHGGVESFRAAARRSRAVARPRRCLRGAKDPARRRPPESRETARPSRASHSARHSSARAPLAERAGYCGRR